MHELKYNRMNASPGDMSPHAPGFLQLELMSIYSLLTDT